MSLGPPTDRWLLEYISWCAIASRNAEWWPVIERLGKARNAGLDIGLLKLVLLASFATGMWDEGNSWIHRAAKKAGLTRDQQTLVFSNCEDLKEIVER